MTKYTYYGTLPHSLEGRHPMAPGDSINLSSAEEKLPGNERLIGDGTLVKERPTKANKAAKAAVKDEGAGQ